MNGEGEGLNEPAPTDAETRQAAVTREILEISGWDEA